MTKNSRANVLLGSTNKPQEFFSDFFNDFVKTPFGNQLGRVINEKSVNQSIKNLIFTNIGERFFQPTIGSNIYHSLFELNDYVTEDTMEFLVRNCIENNEKRANLIDVIVQNLNDLEIGITIKYTLINNPTEITLNLILKRVR